MDRTSRNPKGSCRSGHEGFIQVWSWRVPRGPFVQVMNGPSFGSLFHVESRLFLEVQFHQVMWFFSKCKNSLNDENFRKTFHVGVFHVFFKMESWESSHFSREFSWDFSSLFFYFEGFEDFWMDLRSSRWWIFIKRTVGFDPGPEWTLAIGLTHASWTHARIWKIHRDFFLNLEYE